jgi:hypothetical protein
MTKTERDRVHLVESGGADGYGGVADQLGREDRALAQLVAEGLLRADVVDVGDELAGQAADQVEQGVTVEVDPDQGAGDTALVAGEAARVGRAHGVDGGLLTGDGVADRLDLGACKG